MFQCYLAAGDPAAYSLSCADTLGSATDILKSTKIDWVFLDDRLAPYKSAVETLPLLKPSIGDAKVVIISSSIEARHLQCSKAIGVYAVIDKFKIKSFLHDDLDKLGASISEYAA